MSGRMEKKGKKGKKKGKRQAKEAATVVNTVHREFQCDRCRNGKEIEGIRYSCKVGSAKSGRFWDRNARIMICADPASST